MYFFLPSFSIELIHSSDASHPDSRHRVSTSRTFSLPDNLSIRFICPCTSFSVELPVTAHTPCTFAPASGGHGNGGAGISVKPRTRDFSASGGRGSADDPRDRDISAVLFRHSRCVAPGGIGCPVYDSRDRPLQLASPVQFSCLLVASPPTLPRGRLHSQ